MPLNSSVGENGAIKITSGERLTIENAAEFSRIITEALADSGSVLMDFEPEVEIDITGMQILCSACKSAAQSGKTFSFQGSRPHNISELITTCGAERHATCKHNNDSTCIWFGGA